MKAQTSPPRLSAAARRVCALPDRPQSVIGSLVAAARDPPLWRQSWLFGVRVQAAPNSQYGPVAEVIKITT